MLFSDGAEFHGFAGLRTRAARRAGRGGVCHQLIIHKVSSVKHFGRGDNVEMFVMQILMVASESQPFAKTGGLADVVGALPRALVRLGHTVDVVMPRYRGIEPARLEATLPVPVGAKTIETAISSIVADGVRTLFVHNPQYFERPWLYGSGDADYPDNPERFTFLASAALEWARFVDSAYDVIHGHDWQAAMVPVLAALSTTRRSRLARPISILTIHNLAYQGVFDADWLQRLGLPAELMRIDALEYWGRISFLKGGIVFSRKLTTVSPRYAEEIQSPELGFGFDGLLRERRADLIGILNGIDYDRWDPAHDPNLPEPFCASNLEGKQAAKRKVLEVYGLPGTAETLARPIVGMISRLVDQKGFDLLAALSSDLLRFNATFVLLGTGERRYEDLWQSLAARHPDRIGAKIGFDEGLAHLIEGGADLFLMPSRFEPCGLNQMYSLRYGTVPVVRAIGGLVDTVRNFEPQSGEGTGFVFIEYTPEALLGTLRRALETYRDREVWRRIQMAGMRQDFSWEASARQYVTVYERAMMG
jgi:starch synthase